MSVVRKYEAHCPRCHSDVYMVDTEDANYRRTYMMLCSNFECGLGTPPCATEEAALTEWDASVAMVDEEKLDRARAQ